MLLQSLSVTLIDFGYKLGDEYGIRIRVTTVKGSHPSPLDELAIWCRVGELDPKSVYRLTPEL